MRVNFTLVKWTGTERENTLMETFMRVSGDRTSLMVKASFSKHQIDLTRKQTGTWAKLRAIGRYQGLK